MTAQPLVMSAIVSEKLEKLFTLNLKGTSRVVGRVPGGIKVDVEYFPASSTIDVIDSGYQGGSIVSGQDWIMVNENGVVDFSGRLTLKFGGTLVGAHLSGRADLVTAYPPGGKASTRPPWNGAAAYERWQNGFAEDTALNLAAEMTFEVAEGSAAPFSALERALFLGLATVTFDLPAQYSPIKGISVTVCRITFN